MDEEEDYLYTLLQQLYVRIRQHNRIEINEYNRLARLFRLYQLYLY